MRTYSDQYMIKLKLPRLWSLHPYWCGWFLIIMQVKPNERDQPLDWWTRKVTQSSRQTPTTEWNLTFQSTEWLLKGDWMVTGKVDFSSISVTIQWPFSPLNIRPISVTFQSVYFLKNIISPNAARTRDVRIKGKVR